MNIFIICIILGIWTMFGYLFLCILVRYDAINRLNNKQRILCCIFFGPILTVIIFSICLGLWIMKKLDD